MHDKHVLILDFDGVIINSLPLIDAIVEKIEKRATDSYLKKLIERETKIRKSINRLEYERVSDCDEIKMGYLFELESIERLKKEHYDLKDQVLEEVYPEYRNIINYSEIYQFKNAFSGVIETIWNIWANKVYDRIIIASHYNSENERLAKEEFLNRILPIVEFLPIKFHLQPYFNIVTGQKNNDRNRTNKIRCIVEYLNIARKNCEYSLENISFIDDTLSIINETERAGVKRCYYKDKNDDTSDLLKQASFDTYTDKMNERGKRLGLKI